LEARASGGDAEAVQKISNRSPALAKGRIKLNRTKGHNAQRQQADDRTALIKDAIELCVLKGASSLQAVAECLATSPPPAGGDNGHLPP
jgi:hypothetical protein